MKVLQSIARWFKAKDDEVAEKIERENEVSFAKQDLEGMRKDLSQVSNSVGEVKASLTGLKRDMADKRRTMGNLEDDASALLGKGKDGLASKVCEEIDALEQEIQVYESSIEQQENMLKSLNNKRQELKDAVNQAESSLRMMKTMDSVARASEKVTTIKVADSSNALSRFKDRQNRVQQRLDKAKALNEMADNDSGDSLKKEINSALGRSKGSKALARLKKQNL